MIFDNNNLQPQIQCIRMMKNKSFVGIMITICILLSGCSRDDITEKPSGHTHSQEYNDSDTVGEDGPNILQDGGIELWYDFYHHPCDWAVSDLRNVSQNKYIVYEGASSAKMKSAGEGVTTRISQVVPVVSGCKIRIRFRYFVEQWREKGARIYCYFRTRAAESSNISIGELRSFYSADEYYIFRGGGYGKRYLSGTLGCWQEFNETITVPPTASYLEFGVNSYYGVTMYLDDCYIGEIQYSK